MTCTDPYQTVPLHKYVLEDSNNCMPDWKMWPFDYTIKNQSHFN